MSSREADVKPFSANTSSAASRRAHGCARGVAPASIAQPCRRLCHGILETTSTSRYRLVSFGRGCRRESVVARRIGAIEDDERDYRTVEQEAELLLPNRFGGNSISRCPASPTVRPVRIWAIVGGAILGFQLYVWIRWITGPDFERVPSGPSDPPTFMKAILTPDWRDPVVGLPVAHITSSSGLGSGAAESRWTACSGVAAVCCSSRIRC